MAGRCRGARIHPGRLVLGASLVAMACARSAPELRADAGAAAPSAAPSSAPSALVRTGPAPRDPDPPPIPMPEAALDGFRLRVTRTRCFGPCPAYYVEVNASGQLRAKRQGTGPLLTGRKLSKDELLRLSKACYDAGFFELKSSYPARATDAYSIRIELDSAGRSKSVSRDDSNPSAPAALIELQHQIESITGALAYGYAMPTPTR